MHKVLFHGERSASQFAWAWQQQLFGMCCTVLTKFALWQSVTFARWSDIQFCLLSVWLHFTMQQIDRYRDVFLLHAEFNKPSVVLTSVPHCGCVIQCRVQLSYTKQVHKFFRLQSSRITRPTSAVCSYLFLTTISTTGLHMLTHLASVLSPNQTWSVVWYCDNWGLNATMQNKTKFGS